MLTDPNHLQDLANRDFRDLASEEFDTRTLLRNAVLWASVSIPAASPEITV